jgi:cyclase
VLKKRLIGCLNIKNDWVVQSIGFEKFLPIGKPSISVEFLNRWGIDEIIVLDLDAQKNGTGPNFKIVEEIAYKSFVPLTIGGGIRSLDDIKKLIRCGADKISINTLALKNPLLIKQASMIVGDQCIVVSMDIKKNRYGKYRVYSYLEKIILDLDPIDYAKKLETLGIGEILVNSVDNDGKKNGFDLEIIRNISQTVNIPIIACGGAGHPKHFVDCYTKASVDVVAAGNYFHFTEHSPITTKQYLKQNNIDVRLDTQAKYEGFTFDTMGRVRKRSDDYLNKIRFIYEAEELI